MPFLGKMKLPYIRKSMLDSAHYVADNIPLRFSDNERFWRAIERVEEKIRRIVLRQANTINVYDGLYVRRRENTERIIVL